MFRGAGVRSWFDWDRFAASCTVTETVSRSRVLLGSLSTVWYADRDGRIGDWRRQHDRRIDVQEASERRFPSAEGRRYIEAVARSLRIAPDPPLLVLPCFRTASGSRIILDGNHRCVAAFESGREPRLLLLDVRGPEDALLLPDLAHEIASGAAEAEWARLRARIEEHFGDITAG